MLMSAHFPIVLVISFFVSITIASGANNGSSSHQITVEQSSFVRIDQELETFFPNVMQLVMKQDEIWRDVKGTIDRTRRRMNGGFVDFFTPGNPVSDGLSLVSHLQSRLGLVSRIESFMPIATVNEVENRASRGVFWDPVLYPRFMDKNDETMRSYLLNIESVVNENSDGVGIVLSSVSQEFMWEFFRRLHALKVSGENWRRESNSERDLGWTTANDGTGSIRHLPKWDESNVSDSEMSISFFREQSKVHVIVAFTDLGSSGDAFLTCNLDVPLVKLGVLSLNPVKVKELDIVFQNFFTFVQDVDMAYFGAAVQEDVNADVDPTALPQFRQGTLGNRLQEGFIKDNQDALNSLGLSYWFGAIFGNKKRASFHLDVGDDAKIELIWDLLKRLYSERNRTQFTQVHLPWIGGRKRVFLPGKTSNIDLGSTVPEVLPAWMPLDELRLMSITLSTGTNLNYGRTVGQRRLTVLVCMRLRQDDYASDFQLPLPFDVSDIFAH